MLDDEGNLVAVWEYIAIAAQKITAQDFADALVL